MTTRIEQATVIILPMQLDQMLRQRPQHITRTAPIIDPRGLATIACVHPPQNKFARLWNARFFQDSKGRMPVRQIKHGRNFPLRRTAAHKFCPPPPAKHKAKRVEQNRLTCPCFAREHVETSLKAELKAIDQQNVSNI